MDEVAVGGQRKPASIDRFIVPATVMLTFVSFWRASAIVLSDLGSSAYYVGGITEQKIGKAAPWFVLGIMLFSYAVRAVYIESCSMFTRGGVYKVVREAMGGTAAKFSVAALMFDYVLTGPISAVSAGLYLASLLNQVAGTFGLPQVPLPPADRGCVRRGGDLLFLVDQHCRHPVLQHAGIAGHADHDRDGHHPGLLVYADDRDQGLPAGSRSDTGQS